MVLSVDIPQMSIGSKELFKGLSLVLEPKEKVAIIGRNGVGKTTLFRLLAEQAQESPWVKTKRGLRLAATQQEFAALGSTSCLDYILDNLPEYRALAYIVATHPETMGSSGAKISQYSDALERFTALGYYDIESKIIEALATYQITPDQAQQPFSSLSGGQKRFADLVRVELSDAELALVDEPTNHMDYVGKQAFINWLKNSKHAIAVITHDRDVLAEVERIIEIKDLQALSFKGNYEAYLKQNSVTTVGKISDYETAQRTLEKLGKQLAAAKHKKFSASSDSAKKFRIMEDRLQRQYDVLAASAAKPSFWIDQESVTQMPDKVSNRYHQYKARNIRIKNPGVGGFSNQLLAVQDLALGYSAPLFEGVSFSVGSGSQVQIMGRNGAGKTTLIRAILAAIGGGTSEVQSFAGEIVASPNLKIGFYEQEISAGYLNLTLEDAIGQTYRDKHMAIGSQGIMQILADYLFDPRVDGRLKVSQLSGGQKARLQIIKMLCQQPDLLLLDEPTNHLDLPSIEELENALAKYEGAILFVSHDTFFAKNFAAQTIQIGRP